MNDKKAIALVAGMSGILVGIVVSLAWPQDIPAQPEPVKQAAGPGELQADPGESSVGNNAVPPPRTGTCGEMDLGILKGQVSYDQEREHYILHLRGAHFPFKASPIDALEVALEAAGKDAKEKNTALLYGILGPQVAHATILLHPEEEELVMPAATDLARYLQIVNPAKFAGIAYTKAGGKLTDSVKKGPQVQSLEQATPANPKILLRGPRSGATRTRVWVDDGGRVTVEGKTYQDLYKAAGLICVTFLKMLCGSPDCPNAAECATGGDCGCG